MNGGRRARERRHGGAQRAPRSTSHQRGQRRRASASAHGAKRSQVRRQPDDQHWRRHAPIAARPPAQAGDVARGVRLTSSGAAIRAAACRGVAGNSRSCTSPCRSLDARSHVERRLVLLDTTRGSFRSWGYPEDTPVLAAWRRAAYFRRLCELARDAAVDAAAAGGRYYRNNILAPFQPNAHPREDDVHPPRPDSGAAAAVHDAGYATQGVSAHTWVSPDSELGRAFDRFELLPFTTKEAHGDARPLVDRALAVWQARDRGRPLLLYVHFMDLHIPRRLPEGETLHPVPGYDWRSRFRPNGDPMFDRDRRKWSRYDASDFTVDDRAHYAAVYDTRLACGHAARAALRRPRARRSRAPEHRGRGHGRPRRGVGENERIEHPPSLSDGVQHIHGSSLAAASPAAALRRLHAARRRRPSLAALLALPLPAGARVDGRSWFDGQALRASCGAAAHTMRGKSIAASDEVATRSSSIHRRASTPVGRCAPALPDRRAATARRHRAGGGSANRAPCARHRDGARRARPGVSRRTLRDAARRVPPPDGLLGIEPTTPLRCVTVNEETPRRTLVAPGWFTTGRGVALTNGAASRPRFGWRCRPDRTWSRPHQTRTAGAMALRRRTMASSLVPEGHAVGVPVARHRRGARGRAAPAACRRTSLVGSHVLGLRLTPPGASKDAAPVMDPAQRDRLACARLRRMSGQTRSYGSKSFLYSSSAKRSVIPAM